VADIEGRAPWRRNRSGHTQAARTISSEGS